MALSEPVRIELPVPFPLRTVNAWLWPGRDPVLVDCGVDDAQHLEALVQAVRRAGVDPARLTLYLTHGHVDHAGNARRLQDAFGVPLVCPREESPFVETFRRDEDRRNDAFAAAMLAHGVPEEDVHRVRAQSDEVDALLRDCPISRDLRDGERLPFGDGEVTAVRTPGHTPGSTCYLTDDNVLLSGDTLLERITSNAVELRDDDRGAFWQYVRTLESLRRFVGVECKPGHRVPFVLTDAVLDHHLHNHEARRRRILAFLSEPRTAHQVFRHLFPGLDHDAGLFMGMAEVVGHLHALEIDGLARRVGDGVRRFVA